MSNTGNSAKELDKKSKKIETLMDEGKKKGFVTYDELNNSLPANNKVNIEEIENTISKFSDAGIDIVDEDDTEDIKLDININEEVRISNAASVVDSEIEEDIEVGSTDDPVRLYLREMGTVELLSREHEIEIAQRIDDGKLLVLKSMCESPITMKKLIKWYEDLVNEKIILRDLIDLESHIGGEEAIIDEDSEEKVDMREEEEEEEEDEDDLEAAHKLVTSHLKLVVKIALKYKNYGLPITELVSEGNLGLMQAVKKYNPSLGYRLSTYAMWWIKASIQEYVLKSWSLVKIGTTSAQKKLFFSLGKIKNKITKMYSRQVNYNDYPEIAKQLGVSTKEVVEMNKRLSGNDESLNRNIEKDNGDSGEIIELLPENKPSQEITLMNKETFLNKKQVLSKALKVLNDREVNILTARKLKDTPVTLDTLSNEYNISKERVRQIENRAFEKVQNFVLANVSNDGQVLA